ncbi:uncharacterized protein LOC126672661 [Mercurialis annua]|uniref:uncharacterized protein LOC126672661 n=1 Tax=Mercurialis annua TaxID=3986 RepID=UPI00215E2792|nr:uncharacterized protein LOC126672661 [Mercurialis annua]
MFEIFHYQESKREVLDDFLVRKLWPNLDFKFDWVASMGSSGVLLLIWNSAVLCNELGPLLHCAGTVTISGDFNETIHPEERLNSVGYSPSILAFGEFVNNSEMLYLPLQGRSYTWQNSYSRSRIDRCLISADAGVQWPFMSPTALLGNHSDHPFRSVDAWWEYEDFKKFVSDNWVSACEKSSDLTSRLRELRASIKGWNQNVFRDQNKRIKDLSEEIFQKEAQVDVNLCSEEKRIVIGKLKAELWEVEKRVQSIWVQNSRLNCSTAGDRNTKFFHSVSYKHYKNNHISSIRVEDATYTELSDIQGYIRVFIKSLYGLQTVVNFDLSGFSFEKITEEQANGLMSPFNEEEIFKALSSCGERKAPGPDGFNFYFYRRAWRFMKDVIRGFFEDFRSSSFFT